MNRASTTVFLCIFFFSFSRAMFDSSSIERLTTQGIPVWIVFPEVSKGSDKSLSAIMQSIEKNAVRFANNFVTIGKGLGDGAHIAGKGWGAGAYAALSPIRAELLKITLGIGAAVVVVPLIKTFGTKYINKYMFEPKLTARSSHFFSRFINYFKEPGQLSEYMVIPDALKSELTHVVTMTKNIKKNGGTFDNICLFGPPGTGKSLFAEFIAEQCDMDYAIIPAGNISQFLANGTIVERLNELFSWAESSSRGTVLFFDEAEVFLASREQLNAAAQNALSTFLAKTGTPSNKIFIICATNRPAILDDAVKSRLNRTIKFGLPDVNARKEQIAFHVNHIFKKQKGTVVNAGCLENQNYIKTLAMKIEGFSGRAIQQLVNRIRQSALAENTRTITEKFIDDVIASMERNKLT